MSAHTPREYAEQMSRSLAGHDNDIDAIVVGGDHHAIASGMLAADAMNKPLMIVCQADHKCVDSHITTIGDITPGMRFLYVDDFYSFGSTKAKTFAYMNQSEPANIVATYQATTDTYTTR
jgi:hypothetical protein